MTSTSPTSQKESSPCLSLLQGLSLCIATIFKTSPNSLMRSIEDITEFSISATGSTMVRDSKGKWTSTLGKIITAQPLKSCSKCATTCMNICQVSAFEPESRSNHDVGDADNVIVVHCNAGKGRTGTSIACFFLYSGLAENAEDAINYYGRKRFRHGFGIT